jgi:hypothetical protein
MIIQLFGYKENKIILTHISIKSYNTSDPTLVRGNTPLLVPGQDNPNATQRKNSAFE